MEDELILTLDFEIPPQADDLGKLFVALAGDYRNLTRGRVLVVSRFGQGSLHLHFSDLAVIAAIAAPYLKDAVEFAKGVKALADFGKLLKDQFDKIRTEQPIRDSRRRTRRGRGERSIEAIVKTAAKSKSHVRLKQTKWNGETIEVELTPMEAFEALNQMAKNRPEARRNVVADEQPSPAEFEENTMVRAVVDRLTQGASDPHALQAMIEALVAVLDSTGMGYQVEQVASALEIRGFYDLATRIRNEARKVGRRVRE
jgi:hypothetical protein